MLKSKSKTKGIKMIEWIDVKDRLPPYNRRVLLYKERYKVAHIGIRAQRRDFGECYWVDGEDECLPLDGVICWAEINYPDTAKGVGK